MLLSCSVFLELRVRKKVTCHVGSIVTALVFLNRMLLIDVTFFT
jgi:hypothetical protein